MPGTAQLALKKSPSVSMFDDVVMNGFPAPENPPPVSRGAAEDRQAVTSSKPRAGDSFFGQKTENSQKNMKPYRNPTQDLIVSGIHLELTPALKTYVREKTERLFRHEEAIVRMRIELENDAKQAVGNRFTAKGHILINGPAMNAAVSSDDCHKALDLLVDKLDRMLQRRSQLLKTKRNHPRAVEWADVALPKAV